MIKNPFPNQPHIHTTLGFIGGEAVCSCALIGDPLKKDRWHRDAETGERTNYGLFVVNLKDEPYDEISDFNELTVFCLCGFEFLGTFNRVPSSVPEHDCLWAPVEEETEK
jgi:hypothetical protein